VDVGRSLEMKSQVEREWWLGVGYGTFSITQSSQLNPCAIPASYEVQAQLLSKPQNCCVLAQMHDRKLDQAKSIGTTRLYKIHLASSSLHKKNTWKIRI